MISLVSWRIEGWSIPSTDSSGIGAMSDVEKVKLHSAGDKLTALAYSSGFALDLQNNLFPSWQWCKLVSAL